MFNYKICNLYTNYETKNRQNETKYNDVLKNSGVQLKYRIYQSVSYAMGSDVVSTCSTSVFWKFLVLLTTHRLPLGGTPFCVLLAVKLAYGLCIFVLLLAVREL